MFIGVYLVRRGVITADQFVDAAERQMTCRPRLGRLALESGKLTVKQVFAVLREQALGNDPFGETAIQMGFITRKQLSWLLQKQQELTPTIADCLIALGAIDAETLEQEYARARNDQLEDLPAPPWTREAHGAEPVSG